ncbi:MAG: CerR family C-terminal domain-containing protein [Planctomycetes bacterium]|nr:CerR family C-terminal domain-containing protein [Planctomycetota bacterium]
MIRPSGASDIGRATRDRLLAAAGEVFAELGFSHATVREICSRAGANIAAVNYHFGDKQGLYSAVFHYACTLVAEHVPVGSTVPARERLRVFIRAFLAHMLDEGRPAWHGKLMAREMIEPTGVLDDLVGQSIRPHFQELIGIVRELLGRRAADSVVRRCCTSIIGQCVFFLHSRPILVRLDPGLRFTREEIDALSEHITLFSLKGLTAFLPKRAGLQESAATSA